MISEMNLFKEEEKDTQFIKQAYRFIGSKIANFLSKTKITPNQVSLFSIVIGLAAAYFFSRGDWPNLIAGALLLQVSLIGDYTDGCLARKKNMVTLFGDWLDYNADLLIGFAVFFGLSWGVYKSHRSFVVWIVGMVIIALWLMIISMYTNFKKYNFAAAVANNSKKKYNFFKHFLYTHAFVYVLVCIGALFNLVYIFMWIIAIYSLIFYFALLFLLGKNILKYQ